MTSAQPHLLLAAVLLIATPAEAVAAGIGFGVGRALVPISRAATGLHIEWSERFARTYPMIRLMTGVPWMVGVVAIAGGLL